MMTAAEILGKKTRAPRVVDIPEWADTVLVRRLGAAERFAFHQYQAGLPPDSFDHVAMLVALTLVDAEGTRLFTDADVKALNEQDPDVLLRIFRAAMEHNRIGDQEVEKAKGES